MKRIKIGNKFEASAVALGAMRMAGLSVEDAEKVVMTYCENGVDFVDHADIYGGGRSEEIFAEVLKRNPSLKDKFIVQDKVGIRKGFYDASYEHVVSAAEGCLKRLNMGSIDVLLLHRPDALMEPEELAEAFMRLKKDGKVRFFGVSNENAGQMALLDKYMPGEIIIDQMQFGLCHTPMVDEGINVNMHTDHAVSKDGSTLNYCRLHDITIQAWSPFQYGFFEGPFIGNEKYKELNKVLSEIAEKYAVTETAVAGAWILRHPANIQMISGSMNVKRIGEICAGADVTLTREEWYKLYLAAGNPLP
ncbi:MAG: aldo/keto reductase [Clostridia bacterium]|nr:aldo/keto reductase [Clostridia bacterium]